MISAISATAAAVLHRQPASKASDESLVQRIAAGDQLAMRALFARHQVRLYRFLARIVRNETLAEDLVSDVFLDVWRQAASFEARSSVSTWLLAMGRYKALSALRRRRDVELDDKMASTLMDPADNPETAMQKKNIGEVLRQCVAGLSPAHGQIIDLVYYHGKSVSEVAEILAIPEATVKTRMFYARKRLGDLVIAA
jgi:RNA polymerase sigma-70 factor, ECF subfamily